MSNQHYISNVFLRCPILEVCSDYLLSRNMFYAYVKNALKYIYNPNKESMKEYE